MPQLALIYSRYSTSEQRGFSLERQNTLGAHFAAEQGWTVEKVISDEARSAFHGANRYEGASLHEFELEARNGLHSGKVLIVENIDRLSRQGAKAAAQLIWGLNEAGVDVATYHDGHIYRANSGEMLDIFKLVILAQQAHEESSKKSKRTSATWNKRFERIADGTQTASIPHTPHWIDKETGKLNERRTAVLNEIYDLYIDGVGIHRIVGILNARNEPIWSQRKESRVENGWFYSYIYRLLTKRAVLGEYVTNDGKTLATDFYPQAITAEKFNRAQAVLAMKKGNQKLSKGNTNRNLLSQMVFCEKCGGGAHFEHTTDTVQKYRKTNGEIVTYRRKTYRRLRCDKARRRHVCDNQTVLNYDIVEATILDQLLPELIERKSVNPDAAILREKIAEKVRLSDADQTRRDNLLTAIEESETAPKGIVQRIADLEVAIERQAEEIEALQKKLSIESALPSGDDDVALIESLKDDITSEFDDFRIYARGKVNMSLRRLIKRIVISEVGTFRIEPDDPSWWLFDEDGKMLEGAYYPA